MTKDFLTSAEFHRGPDLLRPGSLTGTNVSAGTIAFVFTAFPYDGIDPDIRASEHDHHFICWSANIGHERIIDREAVLMALFGPDFREATKMASYELPLYETDDPGKPSRFAYDSVELRRLGVQRNLFGRYGVVRGVSCLMLWNRCEDWPVMVDKLLVLLDVPDGGLITLGNTHQWWMKDLRHMGRSLLHGLDA
jgi:hypothetical protein